MFHNDYILYTLNSVEARMEDSKKCIHKTNSPASLNSQVYFETHYAAIL